MNDDSVFFLQNTVTDIPLSGTDEVQEEVVDPRQSQQYCLKVHERKKKFLSKLNTIQHKLLVSDKEKDNETPFHSNAHNYEMINNPRDTPFFSLHGPEYDEVAGYFDPRRTKTKDILGQTIYQQQVFLDVQEEIPATNDVLFESFFADFNVKESIDLPPLDLEEICKEDGEISRTFTLTPVSSKSSIPANKTILSSQDDLDDYRDLLIDVLITRNPIKMSNTLKTSNLLQKVLNIASPKDVSPEVTSNGDQSVNSFVDEKSVVGDKSLPSTPKVPVAAKKSALLRLASDPNHSFIDEFDRSLQPSSSSTPKLKSRSNALSKRKKTDQPKTKSPKLSANKLSSEQLNKRQKISKTSSVERSNSENDSSRSPLPPLKPSTPSGCKTIVESPQTSDPLESQKIVEVLKTTGGMIEAQNIAESNVIIEDAEITTNDVKQSQSVPISETETKDEVDRTKKSLSVSSPSCEAVSRSDQSKQIVSVEESSARGVETCKTTLPVSAENGVDSGSASQEGMESSSLDKENYPAKGSDNHQANAVTITEDKAPSTTTQTIISERNIPENTEQIVQEKFSPKSTSIKEASPKAAKTSKKLYTRDVCNAKDLMFYDILKDISKTDNKVIFPQTEVQRYNSLSKRIELFDEDKRNGSNLLAEYLQNGKDKKLGGGSKSLLDAGLMSIRQIKGTDHQGPTPPTPPSNDSTSEPNNPLETSAVSTPIPIDEKLKPLAFKDRAIGQQLMKYCSCWIEETKHSACVDLYGEFLVTINNRYRQQLDMSIVNAALSVLSLNSDRIDPDNFILKTALFTTQLLKVLTSSNQTV